MVRVVPWVITDLVVDPGDELDAVVWVVVTVDAVLLLLLLWSCEMSWRCQWY